MNLIKSALKTRPGKILKYGWFYPAVLLLIMNVLYYLSGCNGGYIDTGLHCDFSLYQDLLFPQAYVLFGTIYLCFATIIALPLLVAALTIAGNEK